VLFLVFPESIVPEHGFSRLRAARAIPDFIRLC
jgi:hypothetical protein